MQNVPTLNLHIPATARSEQAALTSARSSRTSLSLVLRPATARSVMRNPRTPPESNDPSVDEYISIPDASVESMHPCDEPRSTLTALRESYTRSLSRSVLAFEANYRLNPDFVATSPYSLVTAYNTPPPAGVLVQCRVRRTRDVSAITRKYVYTMSTDSGKAVMCSKRISGTRSSYFTITGGPPKALGDKTHHMYLGKLRSNFLGSLYTLFSPGENPDKSSPADIDPVFRKELVSIRYESTLLRSVPTKKGPRHMSVAAPSTLFPTDYYSDPFALRNATDNGIQPGIEIFYNKEPRWNNSVNGYVLKFSERVREPSVKNFQLVTNLDNTDICMQFGKIGENEYSLDFTTPFTPLAAFGIALSSLDFKLCCE
jgi:tubby and related proteins